MMNLVGTAEEKKRAKKTRKKEKKVRTERGGGVEVWLE